MSVAFPRPPKQPNSTQMATRTGYNQIPNWQQQSGVLPGASPSLPNVQTSSTALNQKFKTMLENLPNPFTIFHN